MHKNSKGAVFYGMHFYPGVAEYQEPGKDPYRVFLNEDTIRKMDPTFEGRPVFVEHVEEVDADLDELKKEADGWVVESFYNAADGKHWVKFIVVSERGRRAIQNGMRLSNAYVPSSFKEGSLWNGVTYSKEITGGEYEHLAIVRNPRYEESVVMTPEEFKSYNDEKLVDLKRFANSKDKKGDSKMKLNFFKRQKVENSIDLEGMSVTLPKSGKEMTVVQLVEEMDKIQNMHGYANGDHMVKVGEDEMSVNDLIKKHMDMCNEAAEMAKKQDAVEHDLSEEAKEVDVESVKSNKEDDEDDKKKENEDDEDDKKKENEDDEEKEIEKKKNALEAATKKAEAKKKADAIRNADKMALVEETQTIETSDDKVARGKDRYGK